MSPRPKTILISGWRHLPHSYAIVNQFQCLELLRRDDIQVFFEDRPFHNAAWSRADNLFSAADTRAIDSLEPLPPGIVPDAELRMAHPYDLVSQPRASRTFVFGTAEYQFVGSRDIVDRIPLESALRLHGGSMAIITPSEWSRFGFVRSGAEAQRVHVVPHGVDTSIFHAPSAGQRRAARERLGIGNNEFLFLHIGAMSGNKNVEMIIKGFAKVLKSCPAARLVLKGVDTVYPSKALYTSAVLEALSDDRVRSGLPRVIYIGRQMSFAEIRELYHAADCYVSPYRAEGFNLPVLEAAAVGLPVICTGGGPTAEFTNESFSRYIRTDVVPGELEGLATTTLHPHADDFTRLMQAVISDESFQKRARTEGPAFAARNFTWRHSVEKLLGVLFAE